MLRNYYQWRYKRREKRPSFSFHKRDNEHIGPAFGHYLSQRGSHQVSADPHERRLRWKKIRKIGVSLGILALAFWLFFEIVYAIRFF